MHAQARHLPIRVHTHHRPATIGRTACAGALSATVGARRTIPVHPDTSCSTCLAPPLARARGLSVARDARQSGVHLSRGIAQVGSASPTSQEGVIVDAEVRALRDLADARDRAVKASELATRYQEAVAEASRVRREALEELVARGMTQGQIADLIGTTRARVGQLLASGPRSERA